MKKKTIILFFISLIFPSQSFNARRESSYYEFIRLESDQPITSMLRDGEIAPDPSEFVRGERRLRPLLNLLKQDVPFDFIFSGYVRNMTYWDTRQVFGFADDYILIFPKDRESDACGNDINATGQFNMLPIETRVIANIFGPKIGKAFTGARISADFIAIPSGTLLIEPLDAFNRFRMRHAYLKIGWPRWSLLAGQTWHPMTFPIIGPDTVNSVRPFTPGSRIAQIRFTYHHDYCELVAAVLSQTFTASVGPRGATNQYARNSLTPDFAAHATVFLRNHTIGVGIDYKRLVPRLVTNKDIKTDTAIGSLAAIAHVALHFERFDWHNKVCFAQNGENLGVLGGYAVHSISPCTDKRTYTNLRSVSMWTELILRTRVEPAIFIAYLKNLGANETIIQSTIDQNNEIEPTVYAFFLDVDHAFRISPRVRWTYKAFVVEGEVEYTRTVYGDIDNKGNVINTHPPVGNFRFLFGLAYYF